MSAKPSDTPETDAWYAAHPSTLDTAFDAYYAREFGDFARSLERRLRKADERFIAAEIRAERAEAALAKARDEALEEAAKVCDVIYDDPAAEKYNLPRQAWGDAVDIAAGRIRALKGTK